MSDLPQVFNYESNPVRVIIIDDEPWFVAKDVCAILELPNVGQALSRLDEDEKNTIILNDGTPGNPNMSIANEPGLYSLILSSRKPEAKSFKRWITHEVIPAINKHGAYMTPETIEEALTNPDFIIQLATRLKEEQAAKKQLQEQINKDRPYTNFAKAIENSTDSITLGEFAKVLNNNGIRIGRNRFFDWLRDNRYLIQHGKEKNKPQQRYVEQGLFQVRENVIHAINGDLIRTTTLITGKGQLYFLDRLRDAF